MVFLPSKNNLTFLKEKTKVLFVYGHLEVQKNVKREIFNSQDDEVLAELKLFDSSYCDRSSVR